MNKENFAMKEIRVRIPGDVCADVERRFFEYNAAKDIIAYLSSRETVLPEHLERFINQAEFRFTELEMVKEQVTKQYKPEGLEEYGYTFDFDDSAIVYSAN